MTQQIFSNGSKIDTRDIMIRIKGNFIAFYFYEQYLRQQAWVDEETEYRLQNGMEELTDYEKGNHEFYWIPKDDWKRDKTERLDRGDNWHNHMSHKNWFTKEMKDFIDSKTL